MTDNWTLLTTEQAAALTRERFGFGTKKTFEKGRVTGDGPPFVKVGARLIRYRPAEVLAWAEARISPSFTSTSAAGLSRPRREGRPLGRPKKSVSEEPKEATASA